MLLATSASSEAGLRLVQIDPRGSQAEVDRHLALVLSHGVKERVPIPKPMVQLGRSSSTGMRLVGTDVPSGATIVELVLIEHAEL